ncbi:MAG: site-specific DNA-methyltransferase [Ignavibacterium sp.]|jgi:adenine-specific DNA-methyltransferase|nr:site-specific DNA-methyltransferase [Ignavibacterium sp.]
MPQNPKENFIELLKELFQLNNTDLDFGIYRILKLRSRDVEEFINNVLPEKLEEVKKKLADRASADVKRDLETVTTELKTTYGNDFETKVDQYGQIELFKEKYSRYSLLKEKLDNARISEELETDVYNELYRFFERYYEEGDFVTKPRAGDKTYMIPYDGEEVKLYWANYDQYYIKTGENFKNYVFTNGEEGEDKITVEFRIKDVETSVNNNQNQKGRLFIPAEDFYEWNEADKKLSIYFYYKVPDENEKETWGSKQSVKKDNKGINEQLIIALERKINETNYPQLSLFFSKEREVNKKQQKVFYYHLNRYTSLNKFDYFIHKDLKKFLMRELDYFLKNEILSINFLDPDWREEDVQEAIKLNVVKAGVIREAAYTIIDFLSELENFQRRLFEKKKFVVQSEYVMTMAMIPEEVYSEVVEAIVNDAEKKQINEWVDLGFLESNEICKEEIENNKGLVIDTKFFNDGLKFKLLNYIERIDEKSNGLLINSENWQGLNVIENKYKNNVTLSYIDPPYNTELDRQQGKFVYKDSFEHSTWVDMMSDRLNKVKKVLAKDGLQFQSIGDDELARSISLYENSGYRVLGNFVWRRTRTGGHLSNTVNKLSDYVLITDLNYPKQFLFGGKADPEESQPLNKNGNSIKELIFDIGKITFINEDNGEFEIQPGEYGTTASIVRVLEKIRVRNKMNMNPVRLEGNFTWTQNFLKEELEKGATIIIKDKDKMLPRFFREGESSKPFPSMPNEDIKVGTNEDGSALLYSLFNENKFDYPKPITLLEAIIKSKTYFNDKGLIIDYFAGSGTTGHAVIKLNKEDDGNRKFILMEMGEYFESVLLKRLKKIMFAAEWKDGKPKDRENLDGYSTILQYQKLEQYEDSLNNIVFDEQEIELEFEDRIKYRFREGAENSASIMMVDRFADPFNYKMEILQQNERKLQNVDLVTTFNFLLGIDVDKIKTEEHNGRIYRIITGTKKQQNYFVVWRKFDDSLRLDDERDWIKSLPYFDMNAKLYCNADNGFGAESTEAEFKRLMFEDVK